MNFLTLNCNDFCLIMAANLTTSALWKSKNSMPEGDSNLFIFNVYEDKCNCPNVLDGSLPLGCHNCAVCLLSGSLWITALVVSFVNLACSPTHPTVSIGFIKFLPWSSFSVMVLIGNSLMGWFLLTGLSWNLPCWCAWYFCRAHTKLWSLLTHPVIMSLKRVKQIDIYLVPWWKNP